VSTVFEVAGAAFTVGTAATSDLLRLSASAPSLQAAKSLDERDFDAAAVEDDDGVYRYVRRAWLQPDEKVGDAAQPIETRMVVSTSARLWPALMRLKAQDILFAIDDSGVSGVLTRADLQHPAVTILAFSLLLTIERSLDGLIQKAYPENAWLEELPESARKKVEVVYEQRVINNAEISRLDCMMLERRLKLSQKDPLRKRLGLSETDIKRCGEQLKQLRNVLAHGGTVLHHMPLPTAALQALAEAQYFQRLVESAQQ
jgi:hypothetical protein